MHNSQMPRTTDESAVLAQAAHAIAKARAFIFSAGAGMGVDSGLPDFRGNEGFWKAYPPFQKLGLGFSALANPRWFHSDPALAWGFYGHRLHLYRRTVPHDGFRVLRDWAARSDGGAFVFTSNVDGHFQRAGFRDDAVHECHGSIHFLQCLTGCGQPIYAADATQVTIDESTMRAAPPLPACPRCGSLARPAILMFGDSDWDETRSVAQEHRLQSFLARTSVLAPGELVVIECGAGTAVPTVRYFSESLLHAHRATLVRINVREPQGPPGTLSLAMGAKAALLALAERM